MLSIVKVTNEVLFELQYFAVVVLILPSVASSVYLSKSTLMYVGVIFSNNKLVKSY